MKLHLGTNMKVYEMSFEKYAEEIKELVEKAVGNSIRLELITTVKNNGTEKTGLMMSEQESNIKPVIYLNELYEMQRETKSTLENAVIQFLDCYEKTRREDMDRDFLGWENVKERIAVKLINKEWNRELLEDVPHKDVMDLSLVFFIVLDLSETGMETILIRKEHLQMWGIEEQELWNLAIGNAENLLPAKMMTMRECMLELLGEEEGMEFFEKSMKKHCQPCIS